MTEDAPVSTVDLAREAAKTKDEARQLELAGHQSDIVRHQLAINPHLSEAARSALGDQVAHLRNQTGEYAIAIIPKK